MNDKARILAGAVLLGAAVLVSGENQFVPSPPAPSPPDRPAITLRFTGPTAQSDAKLLAAYFREIADELEWDGKQDKPWFNAAVHFDALRVRARVARIKGSSIGDRQPEVRDAIGAYLTEQLGTSGGPVDAAQRAKWVVAFREVARACDAAA